MPTLFLYFRARIFVCLVRTETGVCNRKQHDFQWQKGSFKYLEKITEKFMFDDRHQAICAIERAFHWNVVNCKRPNY